MTYSWIATSSYNTAYSGCCISSSQRRSRPTVALKESVDGSRDFFILPVLQEFNAQILYLLIFIISQFTH